MYFWAVSASCTRRASVSVPAGTPLHVSGTDWLDPAHVNCAGMAPLSAKAELVSRMAATSPVGPCDTGVTTPVDVVFFLPDWRSKSCLPPPLHATNADIATTAALTAIARRMARETTSRGAGRSQSAHPCRLPLTARAWPR